MILVFTLQQICVYKLKYCKWYSFLSETELWFLPEISSYEVLNFHHSGFTFLRHHVCVHFLHEAVQYTEERQHLFQFNIGVIQGQNKKICNQKLVRTYSSIPEFFFEPVVWLSRFWIFSS